MRRRFLYLMLTNFCQLYLPLFEKVFLALMRGKIYYKYRLENKRYKTFLNMHCYQNERIRFSGLIFIYRETNFFTGRSLFCHDLLMV